MKKAIDDELRSATFRSRDLEAMERIVAEEKRKLRNETIEECARVAESFRPEGPLPRDLAMAAAIRALKDKP